MIGTSLQLVSVFLLGVVVAYLTLRNEPKDEPDSIEEQLDKYLVNCNQCNVLLKKRDAQKVAVKDYMFVAMNMFPHRDIYFCDKHKKPYDRMEIYGTRTDYYKSEAKVTSKGKITK